MALKLFRKALLPPKLSNAFHLTFSNFYLVDKESLHRLGLTMANIVIGTHDGQFHCDEALACFMLKLLPQYERATIVRSRQDDVLKKCDIVVDVGGIYDPSRHRYDHHMRTFNETVSSVLKKPGYNSVIKLSSAGLIFCHFGHEIIRRIGPKDLSDDEVEIIFKRVYDTLIKEVDAIDNGIETCDCEHRYDIVTGLSSRVQRLNPLSNLNIDRDSGSQQRFEQAMSIAGEEFLFYVRNTIDIWMPAKKVVARAIETRFQWDESGEIIVLDQFGPWVHHLFDIEKEQNIQPVIKYAIWKDGKTFRVRAVPVSANSFILRKPLAEPWRGLKDEALERASGIDGAIFVHSVGFIGAHQTLKGAIVMAQNSLRWEETSQQKDDDKH